MGLAHFHLKQYDMAMNIFIRATGKDKENPEPYFHLACLYGAKNNKKEALAWLKKSVRKGFSNLCLLKNHECLGGIRKNKEYAAMVQRLRMKFY